MDKIWIHLESVDVSPINIEGEGVTMVVKREVLRDFRGYFTVDIRRTNGELIYPAKSEGSFIYSPSKELPDPLYLTWWLGGQKEMAQAKARGFGIGSYYIDTCHTVVLGIWEIPIARRCVQSNTFLIINEKDLI
jgi:hypothetical protein